MKLPILASLVMAMALTTSAPAGGVPFGIHVVQVEITNGTKGAVTPRGLAVTVVQLREGKEVARKNGFRTSFSFSYQDKAHRAFEASYLVAVQHRGITYTADRARPPGSADNLRAVTHVFPVRIYETTRDASVVEITADTTAVVRGEKDTLEVIQLLRYRNRSDRTFVGFRAGRVVEVALPAGAFDVAPTGGVEEPIEPDDLGFVTKDPLAPGLRTISYVYKLRVPRTGWTAQKEIVYPTRRFDLLLGEGLRVASPGFSLEESVTLEGREYRRFRNAGLGAGATFRAEIAFETGAGAGLWVGVLAAAGVVLAVTVIAAAGRRRRRSGGGQPVAGEREALIMDVARLDERFGRGEVEEVEYRRRRAEMKRRLEDLTGRLVR